MTSFNTRLSTPRAAWSRNGRIARSGIYLAVGAALALPAYAQSSPDLVPAGAASAFQLSTL